MGRNADVTEWQKGVIAFGRAKGHPVKEVADFAGVSPRTVMRVYQQWRNSRCTGNSRQNCGRKTILTDRDRRRVSRLVAKNRFASRQELLQDVTAGPSQPVSERTLRRELHRMNIWSRVARKRPLLTVAHKVARLQWAKGHKQWTVEDWKRVIWSDESRFCLYVNDARRRVHRRPQEAFREDCVQGVVQAGGGSVMFWGCCNYVEMGPLVGVTVNLNQRGYIELLDDQVLPFAHHLNEERNIPIPVFQDDNARLHRAATVNDWHDEHSGTIAHLDWPAKSPDLNPIENLWDYLEQRVKRQGRHPRNLTELRQLLMQEWLNIDVSYIQNLVRSMPQRIAAVIQARGGVTRY